MIHPSPACLEGHGAGPQFPHSEMSPRVRKLGMMMGPRRILPHHGSLFPLTDEGFLKRGVWVPSLPPSPGASGRFLAPLLGYFSTVTEISIFTPAGFYLWLWLWQAEGPGWARAGCCDVSFPSEDRSQGCHLCWGDAGDKSCYFSRSQCREGQNVTPVQGPVWFCADTPEHLLLFWTYDAPESPRMDFPRSYPKKH